MELYSVGREITQLSIICKYIGLLWSLEHTETENDSQNSLIQTKYRILVLMSAPFFVPVLVPVLVPVSVSAPVSVLVPLLIPVSKFSVGSYVSLCFSPSIGQCISTSVGQ